MTAEFEKFDKNTGIWEITATKFPLYLSFTVHYFYTLFSGFTQFLIHKNCFELSLSAYFLFLKIECVHERTRQGVIMLKSRISLKLGTIDGFGEILTSTKNKVVILNSLGFAGTPPKNHKIYSFLHN